ncbi:glycosyl transferase [Tepiditoga spiralis]|uniref:Glycosyl transferase n=1 Tax=Tepiditoga spiralis TaxID=2108365 RepID=A0A7G1G1Y5_9BACT|nr:glycosyltransferase family 1 protein [Tepiditoga spiralis]BBE30178.1 glycosyl transferase [Tepiditoga spiralis]
MNLLYFTHYNLNNNEFKGVKNKIQSQIKVFKKNKIKTSLVYFEDFKMMLLNEEKKTVLSTFKNNVEKRMKMYKILNNYTMNHNIDILYIRYPSTDPNFISFLKKQKKENRKVFLELPTYPFKNEDKSLKAFVIKSIESLNNFNLKKYVDYIVTFSNHKKIKGIPCININNGIDIEKLPLHQKTKNINKINLIGVANISKWHGYDRIITGLYEYYKTKPQKEVYFHIVGMGNEFLNLKNLVEKLALKKYIKFHEIKIGKELDEIFEKADIGIGSLANHRKGLKKDSALKNREYCARGIPFIIASDDDDFSKNFKYTYKISKTEKPVNIKDILNFYESIKNKNYPEEMREYAKNNLSWNVKMKPIINIIKGDLFE